MHCHRPEQMKIPRRYKGTGAIVLAFLLLGLAFLIMAPSWALCADINAEFVLSMGKRLPPDPGADGQTSLVGVDANNNGVRDDVERWIHTSFPDNPLARSASLQLAGAMQKVMIAGPGAEEMVVLELKKNIKSALECLLATVDDEVQKTVFQSLSGVILNTPERSALVTQLEEAYPEQGIVFDDPSPSMCKIAPDSFLK